MFHTERACALSSTAIIEFKKTKIASVSRVILVFFIYITYNKCNPCNENVYEDSQNKRIYLFSF